MPYKNKDDANAARRKRYRLNPQKYLDKNQQWADNNPELLKQCKSKKYVKNRDKILLKMRQNYDPQLTRERNLRKYGLTIELFNNLLKSQDGKCALFEICGSTEPGGIGTWKIDHEHVEGFKNMPPEEKRKYIRGLLCTTCNTSRVGANSASTIDIVSNYLKKAKKG